MTTEITIQEMKQAFNSDIEQMEEEQAAQFAATKGWTNGGNFFIDTRITRNERHSNNGGDYSFWTEYWHADGKTFRRERASCDFWQPMEEPEFCTGMIDLPQ